MQIETQLQTSSFDKNTYTNHTRWMFVNAERAFLVTCFLPEKSSDIDFVVGQCVQDWMNLFDASEKKYQVTVQHPHCHPVTFYAISTPSKCFSTTYIDDASSIWYLDDPIDRLPKKYKQSWILKRNDCYWVIFLFFKEKLNSAMQQEITSLLSREIDDDEEVEYEVFTKFMTMKSRMFVRCRFVTPKTSMSQCYVGKY